TANPFVGKIGAEIGLVRALVERKAHVAVDAKHRSPRIRVDGHLRLSQSRREVGGQQLQRREQLALVRRLSRLKPGAIVILLELAQKLQRLRRESVESIHG